MSRRKGRILAFQAIYAWDMGGMEESELLRFDWAGDDDSKVFARLLLTGTLEHINEVDEQIKAHLSTKWNFGRLNRVTVAILRISVFPLLFQIDTPPTVIIDEAIAIAKIFAPNDAFRFINALLDSIRKDKEKGNNS